MNMHAHSTFKQSSKLMHSARIALVSERVSNFRELEQYVELMDYDAITFNSVDDLLNALQMGESFDLLLASLSPATDLHQLQSIRRLTDASWLFMVTFEDFRILQEMSAGSPNLEGIDFMLTPFDPRELRLRLLMMAARAAANRSDGDLIWGDYHFRMGSRTVFHRGNLVRLQPREFELALELFRNMGRVLTREWLSKALWGRSPAARSIDVCASNVRKKLDLQPENNLVLHAVYGLGYQLTDVPTSHPANPWGPSASQEAPLTTYTPA